MGRLSPAARLIGSGNESFPERPGAVLWDGSGPLAFPEGGTPLDQRFAAQYAGKRHPRGREAAEGARRQQQHQVPVPVQRHPGRDRGAGLSTAGVFRDRRGRGNRYLSAYPGEKALFRAAELPGPHAQVRGGMLANLGAPWTRKTAIGQRQHPPSLLACWFSDGSF